ncbi:uroporphyrinogen decarboxylase [Novimethylophilus kurashikiensis]|uniref:Uroporphyrinogen decarboxylase n=1 Tax=Novimethylophilus kurashikiensis TaxID=1825523 RepID=A0A2R5FCE6_9PROT|nr:hypothetical protein [Novimethylophilus kurashikiensis]GBG14314.1 uroporphyrinogen decarboxylase [Novimethylophilus kurashikiensis]
MQAFIQELDAQFGTDQAMGVYFDVEGMKVSAADFDARADEFQDKEYFSCLPDGSSATCCTNYAVQVRNAYPGRVQIVGFHNENNPTSRVAIEGIHPGGHDFAILDDRYLIDPWIKLVAADTDQIIYDLQDPDDAAKVAINYGPASCWEPV